MPPIDLTEPFSITIVDANGDTVSYGNAVAIAFALGDGRAFTVGDPDILAALPLLAPTDTANALFNAFAPGGWAWREEQRQRARLAGARLADAVNDPALD